MLHASYVVMCRSPLVLLAVASASAEPETDSPEGRTRAVTDAPAVPLTAPELDKIRAFNRILAEPEDPVLQRHYKYRS